jgi:hypothetical protein
MRRSQPPYPADAANGFCIAWRPSQLGTSKHIQSDLKNPFHAGRQLLQLVPGR